MKKKDSLGKKRIGKNRRKGESRRLERKKKMVKEKKTDVLKLAKRETLLIMRRT